MVDRGCAGGVVRVDDDDLLRGEVRGSASIAWS
jgi:hypothetical protein